MDVPSSNDGFYRVVMPYMCCGFDVKDGRIIDCAPIMIWAKGKTLEEFSKWVNKKLGTIEKLLWQ